MSIEFDFQEGADGVATLTIRGDMDMNSSPEVREKLTGMFEKNQKAIIIDLSAVPYIDSSGIATLVEGLQWSHSSKNKFFLAGMTAGVKDVFEIARLLPVFDTFDTPADALAGV